MNTPKAAPVSVEAADLPETVAKALRKAFGLGQTYWQQADSEYTSQHRKADETSDKFQTLVADTVAALTSQQEVAAPWDIQRLRALALRCDASEHGPGHLMFANNELLAFAASLAASRDQVNLAACGCGVATQWQPIETAPKTGRTILLGYFNSHNKWRTMRGQWMSEEYIAENWEEPENGEPGWFEESVEADDVPNCWATNPTHWMPLPAAPKAQEGNK